jgi:hypothetical protein
MRTPLSVNLVVRDNGLGLSRDANLLANALKAHGCTVHITGLGEEDERLRWRYGHRWRAFRCHVRHAWSRWRGKAVYDINIMFEHLWPLQLPLARYNIALPNPEWFDKKDLRHLSRMDRIWAKTRHAQALFRERGCTATWVGFDSVDNYDPAVTKKRQFFHLAGGSWIKGTERLLALWRKHPEWPTLTVLQHPSRANVQPSPANLLHRAEYLSPADPAQLNELNRLQNEHWFHLCPSETDGWGHYLVEAMGVAAIAVTLDAPPMNELMQPDRGLLVRYDGTSTMGMSTTYFFDEAAMEAAVQRLLSASDDELSAMGAQARQWFEHNHADFARRIGAALAEITP